MCSLLLKIDEMRIRRKNKLRKGTYLQNTWLHESETAELYRLKLPITKKKQIKIVTKAVKRDSLVRQYEIRVYARHKIEQRETRFTK